MKSLIISLITLLVITDSCKNDNELPQPPPEEPDNLTVVEPVNIKVSTTTTTRDLYAVGDQVVLNPFDIRNSSEEDLRFDSAWIEVGRASNNGTQVEYSSTLELPERLEAGESMKIEDISLNTANLVENAYLVHLRLKLSSLDDSKLLEQDEKAYLTFFRTAKDAGKLTFQIEKEYEENLPVYKLRGGLSAEYAVQKSAASLNRGIAHSWIEINPPRQSSPDFLQKSIDETVNFYDEEFGPSRPIKRVIISTGITPVSYISRAMDAPILPLHYLVGASTIKEIQTILDQANGNGLSAYATYGHDYSLSTHQGVAWIKLLDLPKEYVAFLNAHQVEEVVFFGATARGGGEKAARQFSNGTGHREPGSIYLMYFAGAQAERYLNQVIKDFDPEELGDLIRIADWESGIIQKQVDVMSQRISSSTNVSVQALVTSGVDDIHLWNMASYTTMKLFEMNRIQPTGISLNPYLAGHPFYESYFGIVPFTYFNAAGFPLSAHTDRIEGMLTNSFRAYFPELRITDMKVYANTGTRADLFGWFRERGHADVINLPNEDIWDLSDGTDSPSEIRAQQLLDQASATDLKAWADGLTYLSIEDLEQIAEAFPEINVIIK